MSTQKQNLIGEYNDPLDHYGDKFLHFDLELGVLRENHFAINEMLDKLPAVYDYFSSLLLSAQEEFDMVDEELGAVEAEARELIQDLLVRERNLPRSARPTGEDIKARFKILFGQYQYVDSINDIDTKHKICNHYGRIMDWLMDAERIVQVDTLWHLFVRYYTLKKRQRELSHSVSLLSNRTTALKMRKDTLLSSVGILKDAGGKGLIVRGNNNTHIQEVPEDTELIIE